VLSNADRAGALSSKLASSFALIAYNSSRGTQPGTVVGEAFEQKNGPVAVEDCSRFNDSSI
jgi:hypothetical protein